MELGLIGEFNCYQMETGKMLLVEPNEEASSNLEVFKDKNQNFSNSKYRGKKTIILKNEESIEPVELESKDGFYEGLFYYHQKRN